MKIWKYKLPVLAFGEIEIEMPEGAEMLQTVGVQNGVPCIWALVDPENKKEKRTIFIAGTGEHEVGTNTRYLGTYHVQEPGLNLVYHVFEVKK